MKKVQYAVSVLLIGLFLWISSGAEAWEIDFQPHIEGGVTYYAFESETINDVFLPLPVNLNTGSNITQETFEFSDYMPFVSYGGTVFFNRFYLDFTGLKADNGKDSTTTCVSGYSYFYDEEWAIFYTSEGMDEARLDRSEMAVSLGYAVSKRFNVYAGYKWAETKFHTTYRYTRSNRFYEYDYPFPYDSAYVIGNADFRFEYGGPFLGGIYGWEMDFSGIFNGIFTASLALARLSGKVKLDDTNGYFALTDINGQSIPEDIKPADGLSLRYNTKGKTLGATLGLAWRGFTAIKGLSYFLGVNGYRYEFDSEDNTQSDINETAVSYRVGLSYLF